MKLSVLVPIFCQLGYDNPGSCQADRGRSRCSRRYENHRRKISQTHLHPSEARKTSIPPSPSSTVRRVEPSPLGTPVVALVGDRSCRAADAFHVVPRAEMKVAVAQPNRFISDCAEVV